MRRLLVRSGLALLIIVGLITVIGWSLPRSHEAHGEAALPVPPATLFETLTNVEQYATWRSNVDRVEVLAAAPLRWREHDGGDAITFEVVEAVPPQSLRVRIADADLPFGGTWTYQLTPEGSGTRLRITESGEVYNPIFRFVSRFIIGHTATIERYLADLRTRFVR